MRRRAPQHDADLVARGGRYSLLAVAANRREVEFGDHGPLIAA